MPSAARSTLRFLIPPGMGAMSPGNSLERYLSRTLGRQVEVSACANYETLAKELLADRAEAAWAPPFVCARLEAMGVKVVARGVRKGASTYRSALVTRAGTGLTLETLQGTTAAWVDRDSVAGYLLPLAHLRARGLEPAKLFFAQEFLGSYRAALEAVLAKKADVAGVFAPPAGVTTGVDEVFPEKAFSFHVIDFTEPVPNEGVALSVGVAPSQAAALEKVLLAMHETPEGNQVLGEAFRCERFEAAPRLGYRALYRVALASL
ncbi:MAG: phosphate/phosphite/phosphonate ABC transporter substrate-binding protein [Myxococcota bacterium]|nr:phosphate/phosphite/phosphonate ABC transporter substrate-binding protein [Myxococcota bacterium]